MEAARTAKDEGRVGTATRPEGNPPGRLVVRTAALLTVCAAVALVNWGTASALFHLSRDDATASHLILIPLVTVALIFQERDRIFTRVRTDWAAGLTVMIAGVAAAGDPVVGCSVVVVVGGRNRAAVDRGVSPGLRARGGKGGALSAAVPGVHDPNPGGSHWAGRYGS